MWPQSRTNIHHSTLFILLPYIFSPAVLAEANPEPAPITLGPSVYTGDVTDYYDIPRGDAPASCEPYLSQLNQYLGEVFSMSGAAYDVLVKLTDRTSTETEFVTGSEVRLLYNFWGIDLWDYSRKKVDQIPEAVLESFRVIKAVYQALTPLALKSRTPKPRLYCDSTFLVWTDTAYTTDGTKVPEVPFSQVMGKNIPEISLAFFIKTRPFASGFYYPDKKEYVDLSKSSVMRASRCTNRGLRGFNLPKLDTLVLCPGVLKGDLGLQSIAQFANGQESITVGTRDPDNGGVTSEGDSLEVFKGLTAVWLHEMSHLIGNSMENDVIDQPGYDINEQPLPQDRDQDGSILRSQLAYGFKGVTNLAFANPAKAKFNADSYTLYALGCYLSKWDWALGAAMPLMVDIPRNT